MRAAGFGGHESPVSNAWINRLERIRRRARVCVCDHVHRCIFMNVCVFIASGGTLCGMSEKILSGCTVESFNCINTLVVAT